MKIIRSARPRTHWGVRWLRAAALGMALVGPGDPMRAAVPTPDEQAIQPVATIQDIMDAEIDPAADALWDSVTVISTPKGTDHHQPRTRAEWQAVRRNAIVLLEATNLLTMEGRRVADANNSSTAEGRKPAEIQQQIDASRSTFVQFARALRAAALDALHAIDAKDPKALMNAGGKIDATCDACHITYWYPAQK